MTEIEQYEPAGKFMTLVENDDGSATIKFDDVGTGRVCGECTLCCKLMPVPQLLKGANERCKHQKVRKGCTIYEHRPMACRFFSCRWLADPSTAGMPRPDRAHYVIDVIPDKIVLHDKETGQDRAFDVLQVWLDPAFPNARHAPDLRAFMLNQAERFAAPTMLRFDNKQAVVVFPPPISGDGQWHEMSGSGHPRSEFDQMADLADRFKNTRVVTEP